MYYCIVRYNDKAIKKMTWTIGKFNIFNKIKIKGKEDH